MPFPNFGFIDTTLIADPQGSFIPFDPSFQINHYRSSLKNTQNTVLPPARIRPLGKWFQTYINPNVSHALAVGSSYNSIFAVSRQRLQRHGKIFYEYLLPQFEEYDNSEVVHYLERTWNALFA